MIGKRLYQIIKESGYTQETAGNLIGSGKSTINTWIKKENVQNSTNFYRLCKIAGWNPDWILTGEGEKYIKDDVLNEGISSYGNEEAAELRGQIKLLKEQLERKDEIIRDLLGGQDKKETKRGVRSG